VRAAFKLPGIRRKVAARGLSKLSVWRLRLGIAIERIKPGHPEQNGRHERMHLTLNEEATKPAAANVLQQQARFDAFLDRYNRDRPHQALCMKVPGLLHTLAACIPRPGGAHLPVFRCYGDGDQLRAHLCWKAGKINLSHVLAGQNVGSHKLASASGSSPSCTMTSATSTMRRAGSNRSRTRLDRKCYLSARNKLLPIRSG
jgi:Integrase core domain